MIVIAMRMHLAYMYGARKISSNAHAPDLREPAL